MRNRMRREHLHWRAPAARELDLSLCLKIGKNLEAVASSLLFILNHLECYQFVR